MMWLIVLLILKMTFRIAMALLNLCRIWALVSFLVLTLI